MVVWLFVAVFVWLFVEVVVAVVVVVWLFVGVVVVVAVLLFVVFVVMWCVQHHTPHEPSGPSHNFYPPFHKFYPPLLPFFYHVPDLELERGCFHDQTKGRMRG